MAKAKADESDGDLLRQYVDTLRRMNPDRIMRERLDRIEKSISTRTGVSANK